MRIATQVLALAVFGGLVSAAEAQESQAEIAAAVAALEHVRPLLPFPELTLGATRNVGGTRNIALVEAVGEVVDVPVRTLATPAFACTDRCRVTERRSFVDFHVTRSSDNAVTLLVSWLVPVEHDGILIVRSGRGYEVDVGLREGRWQVLRMSEPEYFIVGPGPGR